MTLLRRRRKSKLGVHATPKDKRNRFLGWTLIFFSLLFFLILFSSYQQDYSFTERHGIDLYIAIILAAGSFLGRNILLKTGLSIVALLIVILSIGTFLTGKKEPGILKRELALSLLFFFAIIVTGGLIDSHTGLPLGGFGGEAGRIIVANFTHFMGSKVIISISILLWFCFFWQLFSKAVKKAMKATVKWSQRPKLRKSEGFAVPRRNTVTVPPSDEDRISAAETETVTPVSPSVAKICRENLKRYVEFPEPTLEKLTRNSEVQHYGVDTKISEHLNTALSDIGIDAEVDRVQAGPVLTQFDLKLKRGQRLKDIRGALGDLSLSLGYKVRLIESVEGRVVGLEVPNQQRQLVRLPELFKGIEIQGIKEGEKSGLKVPMGVDTAGKPFWTDLNKMPHLLIAGTTGSGKSVFLNSLIISMLHLFPPSSLRLAVVDPKVVELKAFDNTPHLIHPVISEVNKARDLLYWLVEEMEERYKLLAEANVRDIKDFKGNMPFIVTIIDEFADLFLSSGKGFEEIVVRLAQKSRAVGIHLILATQRPSANIVTGLIKANFPSRLAFRVASSVESRIILDENGAELLLGNGDMLFKFPGSPDLIRLQGAFLDDEEREETLKDIRS